MPPPTRPTTGFAPAQRCAAPLKRPLIEAGLRRRVHGRCEPGGPSSCTSPFSTRWRPGISHAGLVSPRCRWSGSAPVNSLGRPPTSRVIKTNRARRLRGWMTATRATHRPRVSCRIPEPVASARCGLEIVSHLGESGPPVALQPSPKCYNTSPCCRSGVSAAPRPLVARVAEAVSLTMAQRYTVRPRGPRTPESQLHHLPVER